MFLTVWLQTWVYHQLKLCAASYMYHLSVAWPRHSHDYHHHHHITSEPHAEVWQSPQITFILCSPVSISRQNWVQVASLDSAVHTAQPGQPWTSSWTLPVLQQTMQSMGIVIIYLGVLASDCKDGNVWEWWAGGTVTNVRLQHWWCGCDRIHAVYNAEKTGWKHRFYFEVKSVNN